MLFLFGKNGFIRNAIMILLFFLLIAILVYPLQMFVPETVVNDYFAFLNGRSVLEYLLSHGELFIFLSLVTGIVLLALK